MNEERQIMELFYSSMMSRAMFTFGVFFMAWVALRITKAVTENPNLLGKIVASIFALNVTFFGLIQQGFTEWSIQSTAYQLNALESLSPSAQVFVNTFYVGLPDGGDMGLTSNPLVWVFWACLIAFMLMPLWRSNN